MQGDIMMPTPKRRRHKPKPKPIEHKVEPQPDFVLNETDLKKPQKQRNVLIAPHKHFKRFWAWWLRQNRNERFAIIAALLLIFGAGAIGWFYFIQPNSSSSIMFIK